MKLSPKQQRNVSRVLPFGVIWLLTSWAFLINDVSITRNQNINPETDVTLSWPVLIFANVMVVITGLLVGTMEVIILEKVFKGYSLLKKVLYKFITYGVFVLVIILIAYPIAASIDAELSVLHPEVWRKFGRFLFSFTFLNTVVQLSFSLMLSLVYAAISENIGHNVLINFFTGKYHAPKFEKRIFMFLDMKDSTTIAERLGNIRYFSLLKEYYALMSDPIIDHGGEVYQYIGDEVVISWTEKSAFRENNCVVVFEALKQNFAQQQHFLEHYGVTPDFKAGVHLGEVTVGEIGALKKEIVFSGDVLNTTSRIQALCKEYNEDLIISNDLLKQLPPPFDFRTRELGDIQLKGKTQLTKVHAVNFTN